VAFDDPDLIAEWDRATSMRLETYFDRLIDAACSSTFDSWRTRPRQEFGIPASDASLLYDERARVREAGVR